MQPRTLAISTVLLDFKDAFLTLLREKRKSPALIMMYAFIDICAALVNDGKTDNPEIFQTCVDKHARMEGKPFSSYDLWAARSALLHAFSPLGRLTKPGRAKPIFYYSWDEPRQEVEAVIRAKGHTDFILLDIETIKYVAIDILNSIYDHIKSTPGFETRLLQNAKDFFFDLQAFKLEAELVMLQKLSEREPSDQ
jgi:hypothetical protein